MGGLVETTKITGIKDTTGAGDAFKAGYLAEKLKRLSQISAVPSDQALSAEVIRTFGVRLPKSNIKKMPPTILASN